jgi:hypothetical protein
VKKPIPMKIYECATCQTQVTSTTVPATQPCAQNKGSCEFYELPVEIEESNTKGDDVYDYEEEDE